MAEPSRQSHSDPPRGMLLVGAAGLVLTLAGGLLPGAAWDTIGTAGCHVTVGAGLLFLGRLLASLPDHWWPE